jgi:hypothetical protein
MEVEDYVQAVGNSQFSAAAVENARRVMKHGDAFSVFIDGELAAVGGIVSQWARVGEAWSVWTDVGRAHPLTCARLARRGLKLFASRYDRIQADTVTKFKAAGRWVEFLGFKYESTMPKAGPQGQDFTRYAMFPGGNA